MNVVGTLTLADITNERGIHLTIYATGCIFHYDKDFPQDSGIGFKESDTPNFVGSYYSRTKARIPPAGPISCLLFAPDRTLAQTTAPHSSSLVHIVGQLIHKRVANLLRRQSLYFPTAFTRACGAN